VPRDTVRTCGCHVTRFGPITLRISTLRWNKTKCLVVVPCRRSALFEELHDYVFYIGSKQIEFVSSFCHLSHLINSELSDDEDITKGRNNFIGQVNNTLSYFRSLDSLVQQQLFQSYCTSYYGCELWLLNNPKL